MKTCGTQYSAVSITRCNVERYGFQAQLVIAFASCYRSGPGERHIRDTDFISPLNASVRLVDHTTRSSSAELSRANETCTAIAARNLYLMPGKSTASHEASGTVWNTRGKSEAGWTPSFKTEQLGNQPVDIAVSDCPYA